jgi:hypothetical protein
VEEKDPHEGSIIIGQTIERSDFRIKNKVYLHKHTLSKTYKISLTSKNNYT